MVQNNECNSAEMPNEQQEYVDEFTNYFDNKIVPLIEQGNIVKDKFRSIFWTSFWTAIALLCVNGLFVLFKALIYHKSVTIGQFWFVFLIAALFALEPLLSYRKEKKTDIFGVFLQFFGDWKHEEEHKILPEYQYPILPTHDALTITHQVNGSYSGAEIKIGNAIFHNGKKSGGKGVLIDISFLSPFTSAILLFDKSGFHRSDKISIFQQIKEEIPIPSSNYFKIFTPDASVPHDILCSAFFEKILDIKDDFKSRKMNVMLQDSHLLIVLENADIYFNTDSLWNKSDNKIRFEQLNKQISDILYLVDLMHELQR